MERAIVAFAPLVGGLWVRARARRYRRIGRALNERERAALFGFFDETLLARVRVAVVPRIEDPIGAGVLRIVGAGSVISLRSVRGMAFPGVVAVVEEPPSESLLFHELVHVVQYEALGVGRMLGRYVREFFESGGDYLAITAERCAYALQERFERDQATRFAVEAEVERWMR